MRLGILEELARKSVRRVRDSLWSCRTGGERERERGSSFEVRRSLGGHGCQNSPFVCSVPSPSQDGWRKGLGLGKSRLTCLLLNHHPSLGPILLTSTENYLQFPIDYFPSCSGAPFTLNALHARAAFPARRRLKSTETGFPLATVDVRASCLSVMGQGRSSSLILQLAAGARGQLSSSPALT
jgi:hypothetical protein